MEKLVFKVFQTEIKRQCKFALIAVEQIRTGLTNNNSDLVWYAIQNFLVAAGNISKTFWPSKTLSQKRGEELRKSLGIGDDSCIKPRNFRNHFEHFDERLENWATSSKSRNFVDSNMGSSDMIVGIKPDDFLRNFDHTNWRLTFRGDNYDLRPIIGAIRDLSKKIP